MLMKRKQYHYSTKQSSYKLYCVSKHSITWLSDICTPYAKFRLVKQSRLEWFVCHWYAIGMQMSNKFTELRRNVVEIKCSSLFYITKQSNIVL